MLIKVGAAAKLGWLLNQSGSTRYVLSDCQFQVIYVNEAAVSHVPGTILGETFDSSSPAPPIVWQEERC